MLRMLLLRLVLHVYIGGENMSVGIVDSFPDSQGRNVSPSSDVRIVSYSCMWNRERFGARMLHEMCRCRHSMNTHNLDSISMRFISITVAEQTGDLSLRFTQSLTYNTVSHEQIKYVLYIFPD